MSGLDTLRSASVLTFFWCVQTIAFGTFLWWRIREWKEWCRLAMLCVPLWMSIVRNFSVWTPSFKVVTSALWFPLWAYNDEKLGALGCQDQQSAQYESKRSPDLWDMHSDVYRGPGSQCTSREKWVCEMFRMQNQCWRDLKCRRTCLWWPGVNYSQSVLVIWSLFADSGISGQWWQPVCKLQIVKLSRRLDASVNSF